MFIYIVTQERALSIFSEKGIETLHILIVDEIQNIERVANEGEDRANILFDVLKDVKNDLKVNKIVLSGPRLKNIANVGFEIFGETSDELTSEAPPVLSLTYSISEHKKQYFLKQYSPILKQPLYLKIENSKKIYGLGGSMYNEKFNNYLHSIISKLNDSINIIFSPTTTQARKSAKAFYSYLKQHQSKNKSIDQKLYELSKYIKESVHTSYDLSDYIVEGVAYHTGKTPSHIRKCIEIASSEGIIKNLFCTTTLMQGVNLPANNIVIRNPNLFTKKKNMPVRLTAYEFANLRGRAGRLLIDFIGRSIVLDESSFTCIDEDQKQQTLFKDDYKEIHVGYGDTYSENKEFIDYALESKERIEDNPSKYILTYIRYILFIYKDNGIKRLQDVGIIIAPSLLKKILNDISKIDVSAKLCLKNRYWDPLDLAYLQSIYGSEIQSLPKSVWDVSLCEKILNCLKIMRQKFPY